MVNSGFPDRTPPGAENPANAGAGLKQIALERPEISGTEPDQKYDYASAYVTFYEKGTDHALGTYLMSVLLTGEVGDRGLQEVKVGDQTYEVGLRFKRTYKPYTVYLKDFGHKKYMGTETAKDFRSTVQLERRVAGREWPRGANLHEPPAALCRRDVLPVGRAARRQRHHPAGRPQSGLAAAVLLVPARHGGHDLALYFAPGEIPGAEGRRMNTFSRLFPWLVATTAAVYFLAEMLPASEPKNEFHYSDFGKIPSWTAAGSSRSTPTHAST